MDQSYVRHLLPRLARKAGIERRVHAHGLRHAFAVDMVRSGAPLYVVRDALGHASVATTQVYLSRVGAHEAVEAMRSREWSRRRSRSSAHRESSKLDSVSSAAARARTQFRSSAGGVHDVQSCGPGWRLRGQRVTFSMIADGTAQMDHGSGQKRDWNCIRARVPSRKWALCA